MENNKNKFSKNKWLVSNEFLSKIDFFDKYYIKELCYSIKVYLEHVPVHVIATWDSKNKRIYFKIGKDILYYVPVDVNVSYNDFLLLLYTKLNKHFPSYSLIRKEYREYTEDDIREIQKSTGKKLSEIVWDKKEVVLLESGLISKVNLPDDQFTLKCNVSGLEKKELRKCTYKKIGINENKILDTFLKDLRVLLETQDNEKIKEFILNNSIIIEEKSLYSAPVKIGYEGEMLLNFFKINRKFVNDKAICLSENKYKWGNFEVCFKSDVLKKDCLKLVEVKNEMYK